MNKRRNSRRAAPDKRRKWNDPNLPVYEDDMMAANASWMEERAKKNIALKDLPLWHNDPTYNLKRRKPIK